MNRTVHRWLLAAALATTAFAPPCWADDGPTASPPSALPTLPRPDDLAANTPAATPAATAGYVLPPCGWPKVDFVQPDPLLDRPYAAQPGAYFNTEANFLMVHFRNQLGGPVINPVTGNTDAVAFKGNRFNPTLSPKFEFGYRFEDNWGSVQLGYRNVSSSGHDQIVTDLHDAAQGPADQVGNLDLHLVELSYVSREFALDPNWNMRWGVGPRLLIFHLDSRIHFIGAASDPTILGQSESNSVQGYGLGLFLDLERHTPIPNLNVFGRLEGVDYYARIQQNYAEAVAGAGPALAETRTTGAVGVSNLREVIGLSYEVPQWNHSRFMIGYQYETFFQIGRQSPTSGILDTRGQLDLHGVFLRAEFNF